MRKFRKSYYYQRKERRTKWNKQKKNGITLIALVITIIILLILAGITINLVIGNNGILNRAKEAGGLYQNAANNEIADLEALEEEMEEIINNSSVNYKKDKNGNLIPVPKGFKLIEGSIEEGAVIQNQSDGNEFVWIPVDKISGGFVARNWPGSGGESKEGYVEGYYNPTDGQDTTSTIIQEIEKSIEKYHGYYIGRYEAGTTVKRTSAGQELQKPVIKASTDATPIYAYNYVTWNQALTLAGELYTTEVNGVQTRLVSSPAWDTALQYITEEDNTYPNNSMAKGWYSTTGNPDLLTGKPLDESISNKRKNIYDMGGNVWEWTASKRGNVTSAVSSPRGGGAYAAGGNNYSAGGYGTVSDSYSGIEYGFRIAMYLTCEE